ncbi:MAG: alpha/beta fold hydrolase [bacterium]
MITVICMDGLGGRPEVTFASLKKALELEGHKVVLVNVEGIQTDGDREQRVLNAFYVEKALGENEQKEDRKIFLLGHSAGGGAVRKAAERLSGDKALSGIIVGSQSMPRFVPFMTRQLFMSMLGQFHNLVLGRPINTTAAQYKRLIEPMPETQKRVAIQERQTIAGREARKLAFYPDSLKDYACPTLYIWGSKDQWISASAHRKLYLMLKKCNASTTTALEVEDSGHDTLASKKGGWVIEKIIDWVAKQ